ncbi:MAG: tyrosine-type recombinase/integrase [Gammaproteobacteria bacterium]|nr:tyrosine-type recombinase/integrase [Gammaproteobacteria bacterium]
MKRKGKHPEKALSALGIRNISTPGFYADGNGLYLKVDKSGSKRWIQRIMINRKRVDLGLGSLRDVSLKEARDEAEENRKLTRKGGDPLAEKRKAADILTFAQSAIKVHEMHIPTWSNEKQAQQWINTLTVYTFPHFGDKKMDAIDSSDILAALSPIWTTKPETARRVKQRIGTVLKYAIAKGWRDDNPAATISSALPKDRKKVKAHRSLPYQEVPAAIETIRNSKASMSTKLALEILILTALRSGEVRSGKWEEVDWDNECWTVPGERMKQRKEHKVPLTPRCLAILEQAKQLHDKSGLIFPSANTGKPLSDVTFSKLVRELGLECVPHGFRSSFRVWAGEKTNFPREVCEFALAHVVGDEAERAYQRSDLFDKRRKLMDAWANHCLNVGCSADVVSIQKTA